mmetsp:Transcript_44060/g.104256  ORF Transcript_44060/g.104256 Transcript_44060/m.104256 type:complete len:256 (+) Transcript_44060:143-910(+)
MVAARDWRFLLLCVALGPLAALAWPHYMLDDGCEKGSALVDPTSKPPTIMSIVPYQQRDLLVVQGALPTREGVDAPSAPGLKSVDSELAAGLRRKNFVELPMLSAAPARPRMDAKQDLPNFVADQMLAGSQTAGGDMEAFNGSLVTDLRGAVVAGTPVRLLYNGVISSYGTHVAFVASSGKIENGVLCGDRGGQMLCTTCGDPAPVGFLRSALWTPPMTSGLATLAVSAAHAGPGTPSVVIDRLTVQILPTAEGN